MARIINELRRRLAYPATIIDLDVALKLRVFDARTFAQDKTQGKSA